MSNFLLKKCSLAIRENLWWIGLITATALVLAAVLTPVLRQYQVLGAVEMPMSASKAIAEDPDNSQVMETMLRRVFNETQITPEQQALLVSAYGRRFTTHDHLGNEIYRDTQQEPIYRVSQAAMAREMLRLAMSYTPDLAQGNIRVQAIVDDQALGEDLANYYVDRLKFGLERLQARFAAQQGGTESAGRMKPLLAAIVAEMGSAPLSTTQDRRVQNVALAIAAVICVFLVTIIVAIYLEFYGSKLTTEKEICNYLGMPVIGALPPITRITQAELARIESNEEDIVS